MEISVRKAQEIALVNEARRIKDKRERAKKHTFYFAQEMGDKFFTEDKPHVILLTMLFDLANEGLISKFTASMPPRWGKSHSSTLGIAKAIGDNPDRTHMRNSYSAELAVEKLSHTVRELVKSKNFREIYPNLEINRNANKKGRWYFQNHTSPAYMASGIGGTQSGYGCNGYLVLDDEYADIGTASSEACRRNNDNWIDSTHLARAEKGFIEAYICTRWTPYDRIGQIKEHEKTYKIDFLKYRDLLVNYEGQFERNFERVFLELKYELQQIEDLKNTYIILDVPALIIIDGKEECACPSIFPTEYYLKERKRLISRGQEFVWDAVYMQNPKSKSGTMITELKEYTKGFLGVIGTGETLAYIDPAFGGGDRLAMPIAVPYSDSYYIIDVVYSTKGTKFTIPMILRAIKKHKIKKIEIEGNGGGEEFAKKLRTYIRERGLRCSIRILKNSRNKVERVLLRSGDIVEYVNVLVPSERPSEEYNEFVADVLNIDKNLQGAKDDAIDSLSGLVAIRIPKSGAGFREL